MDDQPPARRTTGEYPPIIVPGLDWKTVAMAVLSVLTAIGMSLGGWVGTKLSGIEEKLIAKIDEVSDDVSKAAIQNAERHGEMRARTDSLERDVRKVENALKGKR